MTNLRHWQWAIIGLLFGAAAGWSWCSIASSGGLFDPATIGPQLFERGLLAKPVEGYSKIKNITLHQDNGHDTLWMKVLEPDSNDRHPNNPRHFRYVPHRLNTTTPFLPSDRSAATQTVMWRVNPSAISVEMERGKQTKSGALPLWINGAAVRQDRLAQILHLKDWQIQTSQWADPQAGAELSLPLRKASYQMHVVLSRDQEKPAVAEDLTITLNGHELAKLEPVKEGSATSWKTTLPVGAFVDGPTQMLRFSRKAEAVKVWEIRLIDPSYSVVDFLKYAQKQNPAIGFAFAWWDTPLARYLICCIGGVVFFGLVVPTIMRRMWGEPNSQGESEYDLSRFQGEVASAPKAATSDGQAQLLALEEQLQKSLEIQAVAASEPATVASESPRELTSEPISAPKVNEEPGSAEYKGEYYPVAKPTGGKGKRRATEHVV